MILEEGLVFVVDLLIVLALPTSKSVLLPRLEQLIVLVVIQTHVGEISVLAQVC